MEFATYGVDLENKREQLLNASPTGPLPLIVVAGDSIYEPNVVSQYLT